MSLKIMVVDDEALTLKVMRSLTVPLGHRVLTLDNGQEAKQHAEKERFDVIFVGMPGPDGIELARQLLDSQHNKDTVVVMLSVKDDIETLRKAFAAGATFVLPKPIAAPRIVPMLTAMDSPNWKARRGAARLPLSTEVNCRCGNQTFSMRSMNISDSGMLLRSSHEVGVEVGSEVSLEFKIAEFRASLDVRARIVRKEGSEAVGVEFVGLEIEDRNAIQLYIMGHLREQRPARDLADPRMHRLLSR
ncbi:MAG: response regulator [Candidatus Acidiferrales bacterium]